jgi:hypothetical protein
MASTSTHEPERVAPDTDELLGFAARQWSGGGGPVAAYAEAALREGRRLPDPVVAAIRRTAYASPDAMSDLRGLVQALHEPAFNCGESWAERANADLAVLGTPWRGLVAHAFTAGARPTAGWMRRGRALLTDVGAEAAGARIRDWLALVDRPRTIPLDEHYSLGDVNDVLDPFNATGLRGLVFLVICAPAHPDGAAVLGDLVASAARKVPRVGARSQIVAQAGVWALSRIPTPAALVQLARLSTQITAYGIGKKVDVALGERAAALGLTREAALALEIG